MHTSIPHGMWQSTSSTQLNQPTVRPRRSPDSTVTNSGSEDGRQHYCPTSTNLHVAGTRQCRAISQNSHGTSENTQSTTTTQLRPNHHKPTPDRTMAGTTHSVLTQQVRSPRGWQHQLLPKVEQRAQTPAVRVWRNSPIPSTNKQTTTKT